MGAMKYPVSFWFEQKFGMLTVLGLMAKYRALVLCDCGNARIYRKHQMTSGDTVSCGCYRANQLVTHGHTRFHKVTPTMQTWRGMKERCNYVKHTHYKYYGGRGITYDPRWEDLNEFIADMGLRPKGHSLDRINNNGPYCKENCRWASAKEQARNSGAARQITYKSETMSIIAWCEKLGLDYGLTRNRIQRGSSPEEAFERPKFYREINGKPGERSLSKIQ